MPVWRGKELAEEAPHRAATGLLKLGDSDRILRAGPQAPRCAERPSYSAGQGRGTPEQTRDLVNANLTLFDTGLHR